VSLRIAAFSFYPAALGIRDRLFPPIPNTLDFTLQITHESEIIIIIDDGI